MIITNYDIARIETVVAYNFLSNPVVLCWGLRMVKSVQIGSFFWSVFSGIRTKYGKILRIYPYSVQMQEITTQKKLRIWTLFTQ